MRLKSHATSGVSGNRSVRQLVSDLRDDAVRLVRQEFQLFGMEICESLRSAGRNGLMLMSGVVVLFFAVSALVIAVCAGVTLLLDQVMPLPGAIVLGPLIVGTLLAISGWLAFRRGLDRLQDATSWPQRSVDALKDTKQWLSDNGAET